MSSSSRQWHGQASNGMDNHKQAMAWTSKQWHGQSQTGNAIAKQKQCHGLDIVPMPRTSIVKPIMVLELGIAKLKQCHGQWQCQAQAVSWT
jgi:hypothetical protein